MGKGTSSVDDLKMDAISNYYQATAKRNFSKFQELEKNHQTDVCIIGGGFAGLSTALEIRQRGYQVCLLEGETIGYGASGRNGGQAIVDVGCGIHKLASLIGWERAKKIFMLTVEGISLIRSNVKKYKIDCDLVDGTLTVAQKKRQDIDLIDDKKLYEKIGYNVELWNKNKIQSCLGTQLYTSAIYDPRGLHLHPLKYSLGLAKQAALMGVKIFEKTMATSFEETSAGVVVSTQHAKINCKQLVICANTYNHLNDKLTKRIMPVGTYIAATKPLEDDLASRLIGNNAAVCDMNFVLDYFRLSADKRLLFGGRVSYTAKPPSNLKQTLYKRMIRVYPYFKKYHYEEIFDYAWGGEVDVTINRAPDFGKLSKQIYFLQGFSGHGVALANIAGKIVAEAIDGDPQRFELFKDIPHKNFFGGKFLRAPLLALGMSYFRMKDYL